MRSSPEGHTGALVSCAGPWQAHSISAWAGDKECTHMSQNTCISTRRVSLLHLLVLLSHGCNASASESRPEAPVLASVLGARCTVPRKSCSRQRAILLILYNARTSQVYGMSPHPLSKKNPLSKSSSQWGFSKPCIVHSRRCATTRCAPASSAQDLQQHTMLERRSRPS